MRLAHPPASSPAVEVLRLAAWYFLPIAIAVAIVAVIGARAPAADVVESQCPPGAKSCPAPGFARPSPSYTFRNDGNPAPWATAVRITAVTIKGVATGSGTIIDGDATGALVMTCAHVLRGASATFRVEVFGPGLVSGRSIGPAVASFLGTAFDRDDRLDVGLIRFRPGRDLVASPLAPESWAPDPAISLCSVGCSQGADPSAFPERFARRVELTGGSGKYSGLQCDREPAHGRSGGGLFNQAGELVGVCDMANSAERCGYYASPESLREILRRNGLVELAAGIARRKSRPPAPVPPDATPDAPDLGRDAGRFADDLGRDAGWAIHPFVAASGGVASTATLGLLAWVAAKLGRRPPQPPSASAPLGPVDQLRQLAATLTATAEAQQAREAAEERDRKDRELLERIGGLIAEAEGRRPKP
jgi:hypothetical protein